MTCSGGVGIEMDISDEWNSEWGNTGGPLANLNKQEAMEWFCGLSIEQSTSVKFKLNDHSSMLSIKTFFMFTCLYDPTT